METFIASVVLFIALFGLSVVTTASAANNRMASLTVDAERLATSFMNQYSALGVTGIQTAMLTSTASTGAGWATLVDQDSLDPSGRTIHVVVEATDVSATIGGVCMQVRTTVSWRNAIGATQTQVHSIYVSQNAS